MAQTVARKLIFRLGEIGFILDLVWVVEICEQIAEDFDASRAALDQRIVGALCFRQTHIPVIDPSLKLDMQSQHAVSDKMALILKGDEGNWALLVDRIEEILPAGNFQQCQIPPLLKNAVAGHYSQVSLLLDEPFVHFEPQQYYGSSTVAT